MNEHSAKVMTKIAVEISGIIFLALIIGSCIYNQQLERKYELEKLKIEQSKK